MRVVPAFDIAEDSQTRFGVRCNTVPGEALDFERREEALGHGVVVGIAARSHRRPYPQQLAALSVRVGGLVARGKGESLSEGLRPQVDVVSGLPDTITGSPRKSRDFPV